MQCGASGRGCFVVWLSVVRWARQAHVALGRHASLRRASAQPVICVDAGEHEGCERTDLELRALVGHHLVGHAMLAQNRQACVLVHRGWQLVGERPQPEHAARAAVERREDEQVVLLDLARQVDVVAVREVRREVVLAPDAVERPVAARGVCCRVDAPENCIDSVSRPVPLRVVRLQRSEHHAPAVVRSMPTDLEADHALRIGVDRLDTQQQPSAGHDLLDPPTRAALPEGYVLRALASLVELHDGGRAHALPRRGARGGHEAWWRRAAGPINPRCPEVRAPQTYMYVCYSRNINSS